MLFHGLDVAPPDPILGLTEAFARDPNPAKINLGVGIYKDADGKTPVLACVKEAERRILAGEPTKNYLPIPGDAAYGKAVRSMLFGAGSDLVAGGRAATAHCPGGTGALRVAADYLHRKHPGTTVWLSDPTWANHPQIFAAAGVMTKVYPYFDPATNGIREQALLAAIEAMAAGDVMLLHGCCHNPTGADPSPAQWAAIAAALAKRGVVPLVDLAYQGFGDGLDEDVAGLRTLLEHCPEMLIASSYSKNFSLYNERVGALTVVAADPATTDAVFSHVKSCIRSNYSNPPAHGAAIITTVLSNDDLASQWQLELGQMRDRINRMRTLFVSRLAERGMPRDMSFISRQRGMFSFSGLDKDQVQRLRQEHAIYIVGSGRISVAGMTESNMDRLCEAIVAVSR